MFSTFKYENFCFFLLPKIPNCHSCCSSKLDAGPKIGRFIKRKPLTDTPEQEQFLLIHIGSAPYDHTLTISNHLPSIIK